MKKSNFPSKTLITCGFFFVLLINLFFTEKSSAQQFQKGIVSEGKDFYIGYVYPSFNKVTSKIVGGNPAGFYNVYALISSFEGNNIVTVSYFDDNGRETSMLRLSIGAHNAIQVSLNGALMKMDEPGDSPQYRACHITAKKPVSVEYFSVGANAGGAYLALPTPALGKNYVVASYNDNPGLGSIPFRVAENSGGYFMVIAPFDSTNITIIPNGLTAGGHKGVHSGSGANGKPQPYTVLLNRGQCYWVKGDGSDATIDMSGSTITSSKPIAVLSGHEDAFLGSSDGYNTESRNFMIQQLIPAEYFASNGYVTIPLIDVASSDPSDPGYGENFRVFTFDTNSVDVQAKVAGVVNALPMTTSANGYPARELDNIAAPVEFHSTDNRKFGVMMYDLRQQGATSPNPAPSMMTIVPMSNWKNSFVFYVPPKSFETYQNYYVNIIGLRSDIEKGFIQYGFNGITTLSKLTNLTNKATYTNIPFHPELKGATYSLSPGSYYFTNTRDADKNPDTSSVAAEFADTSILHGGFMVYFFGMRGIDIDNNIGTADPDDYFFSFGTPVGMSLVTGGSSLITAKIDTFCSSWNVCIHDRNVTYPALSGITSVSLLNDPDGNIVRPGRKSVNVHFDETLDPNNMGEIDYTGKDSVVCINVSVNNPLDTAYAALYISDNIGNHQLLDLRYKAPHFILRELGKTVLFADTLLKVDTVFFPTTRVGGEICSTLVIINTGSLGSKSFTLSNIFLKKNDGQFKISSITPSIPVALKPNDTLKVSLCFEAKDKGRYNDSLILLTDCFTAPIPVIGEAGTPLIIATDIDFGSVALGSQSCLPLTITSVGSLPFLLTKNWLLHDTSKFSMDPQSVGKLPVTLNPGKSITLSFCYKPISINSLDSTTVDWKTDITQPFTDSIKSWSFLRGKPAKPVKPGVYWDRSRLSFFADSTVAPDSVIERINLVNSSSARTHVTNMFIFGADAQEYYILTTQRGTNPGAFDMNVGDILWVDVVFKPDLTKPYPLRYADRHANLVATNFNNETKSDDSTIAALIGTWAKSDVKSATQPMKFTIQPNPVSGNSVIISFASPQGNKASLSVYDILGREVYSKNILSGDTKFEIPIANFSNGTYYARLVSGSNFATQKFEIAR